MPRSLRPYMEILDAFVNGCIGTLEFRTRAINRFSRLDYGVNWVEEWGEDVYAVLDQMDGDAEVYYPEAPEESYITLEELLLSCRENLRRLQEALRQRGVDPDGELVDSSSGGG